MHLHQLPEEEQVEVMQRIASLNEYLSEKLGGPHDTVLMVHRSHAFGTECSGASLLTQTEDPRVVYSILRHGVDAAEHACQQMIKPPGTSLN